MRLTLACVLVMASVAPVAAQRWQDATASCLGTTAEWSSKLELADVDGDGQVDILVANGGDYDRAGTPEPARVWKNLANWSDPAATHCQDISQQAVLGFTGLSRTIKVADVDGDGDLDIFTGGSYQTQAHLYLRGADGWTDATDQLPQQLTSIGDAEWGDVDGDGDLDLVIADWGPIAPAANNYVGGRTRLYLNDGTGHFTDATATRMPATLVGWSWDLTLADVDGDYALDILVSCKACAGSYLFHNSGTGTFTEVPGALPPRPNNYALEPMDIDGDGDLDLATINDGAGGKNRILVNDGHGMFTDETATRLTGTANPGTDDNAVVFLDVDSDGDADMLVASLSGPERLLLNDGTGTFTLAAGAATPDDTPGSLGIAVADLDGDGRLDVVQSQGEVAFPEKVQLATAAGVSVDTAAPVIASVEQLTIAGGVVRARVHDHQSPSRAHDWKRVWLVVDTTTEVDMRWYGEYLWAATAPPGGSSYQGCAQDRRGNQACSDVRSTRPVADDAGVSPDAGGNPDPGHGGGCCDAGSDPRATFGLAGLVLAGLGFGFGSRLSARSRSTARRSGSAPRRRPSA